MEDKELYLFDLDGTLILGNRVIDGAIEAINKIREQGKKLVIFTNNSSRTRMQYVEKLAKLGIAVTEEEIVTAGYITGKYLLKKKMINRHLRKHQRQQVHLLQILNSMQAWEKLQKRELKWEFLHLRHIKRPL